MFTDREIRVLFHKKQPRAVIADNFPPNDDGADGDIGIFNKEGNVYLGIKLNGKWKFRRFIDSGDAINETI